MVTVSILSMSVSQYNVILSDKNMFGHVFVIVCVYVLHLCLPQLPLFLHFVMECEKLCAALPLIIGVFIALQDHLVPSKTHAYSTPVLKHTQHTKHFILTTIKLFLMQLFLCLC